MQNFNNYSLYYLPTTFPFLAYLPATPSLSDISTPSERPLSPNGTFLYSPFIDQAYYQNTEFTCLPQSPRLTHDIRDQPAVNAPPSLQLVKEEADRSVPVASQLAVASNREESVGLKIEQSGHGYIRRQPLKRRELKRDSRRCKEAAPDLDYFPEQEKVKKLASKYQINQNRNIVPNQINQIFSFVQKQNKSGSLTEKLFEKYPHPEGYTPKRFYLYQSLLKNRLGHYSNEKSLKIVLELYDPKCETWSEQEQRYYNRICRVLVHHFLHEDSIFIILTSRRMKREKKSDHLRARREIARAVGDVLRGL